MNNVESLNRRIRRWLGSYVDVVYVAKPLTILAIPSTRQLFIKYFNNQVAAENGDAIVQFHDGTSKSRHSIDHIATAGIIPNNIEDNKTDLNYSQQEMLRDLFLWSVFMDLSLMSKTILIHMQERICASLIAAKVFKAYADETPITDLRDRLNRQVVEFENYSATCVDACYEVSEPLACQLLMRAVPRFGNVTCMQVSTLYSTNDWAMVG